MGRVYSFRDVTDRKLLEDELSYWAFHDSLTRLANKTLFQDRLDHALARSARADTRLAVLFIDLDDFKTVNDTLGHGEGDQLLRRVRNDDPRLRREPRTRRLVWVGTSSRFSSKTCARRWLSQIWRCACSTHCGRPSA